MISHNLRIIAEVNNIDENNGNENTVNDLRPQKNFEEVDLGKKDNAGRNEDNGSIDGKKLGAS